MAVTSFPDDSQDVYLTQLQAQCRSAKNGKPAVASAREGLPYDASSKRRVAMTMVDLCTSYLESMWPDQRCRLPLRTFVFEILRRSRVQYPVFQVAMCYLARCRTYVVSYKQQHGGQYPPKFACGRRILVAALQVASKFLQDRFYSASVWSKVSGLDQRTLQENEIALMQALDWRMCVSSEHYMEICRRLTVSMATLSPQETTEVLTPRPSPALESIEFVERPPTPRESPQPKRRRVATSPDVVIWQ